MDKRDARLFRDDGPVLVPLDDRPQACNGLTNMDGLNTEEGSILMLILMI